MRVSCRGLRTFANLRSDVERDIAAGERPDIAVQRRSASIVRSRDGRRPLVSKRPAAGQPTIK
jgi:hypothetical protein